MIFLVVYDRGMEHLDSMEVFPDADRKNAENRRLKLELDLHHKGLQREIVLLQAEDEEALKLTHRRYFESLLNFTHSVAEKV